jgi:TrmH family RNA methyltransferase
MAIRIVQSKQNARVKELRAALLRPGRADAVLVALEGIHLLDEALRSGLELTTVFVVRGHENLLDKLNLNDLIEVLSLPAEILASAVTTETPQPIAALAKPFDWIWRDLLEYNPHSGNLVSAPLIVVLAGIQDPGNLGTILRSTEAFGASGAVLLPGTVSPWNPKAMRASAGSVFRLPWLESSAAQCFQTLKEAGIRTLAAMAHEAQPLGTFDLANPVAVVIGSEGSGLAPKIAAQCDARITIPCPGPVESLNAAVAASVLLYEASRQRALTLAAPASKKQRRP